MVGAAVGAGVPSASARASSAVNTTGDDYCGGGCHDIHPAGQNGFDLFIDAIGNKLFHTVPPHWNDQQGKYDALAAGAAGLTPDTLGNFFNDASFGVKPADVERTYQPAGRSDVTIVRDKQQGIPHITGTTRTGLMFGAGFAAAEDRLFVMDLLRHLGRGRLTSFAGGSAGNQAMEQAQWAIAPYTEADFQAQWDGLPARMGPAGAQLQKDARDFTAGINAQIAAVAGDRVFKMPGEYDGIHSSLFPPVPQPFTPTDLGAIAAVLGGTFGSGGGGELASAISLQAAQARFGPELGQQVWQSFRSADDPEAPVTVHNGQWFPYGGVEGAPTGRVMPDPGSVTYTSVVAQPAGTASAAKSQPTGAGPLLRGSPPAGMSNALVVSAAHSADGHAMAVFGPQSGYFAPDLWSLEELQGPGIHARGASFAGLNFAVLIGRGTDYAWSATSAGQDITDTFAVPLCNPDGSPPTPASSSYLYQGACTPIETLTQTNSWSPSWADSTPRGGYTLTAQRTKLGLVTARGTVAGRPTLFTRLRSTYMHEADSGVGFEMFNQPDTITSAQAFQQAASHINYTFNWFYADRDHTAYVNSGLNPVRAVGADPDLPTAASHPWRNWNPATWSADYLPASAHPQAVDQDYFTSWNNKPAPGYRASDSQFGYGPVYRSQLLDENIKAKLAAGGGRMTQVQLVQAMQTASVTDLRAGTVLPLALKVLRSRPITDPAVNRAVAALQSWLDAGGRRVTGASGGYENAEAIRILDAWWPLWVSGEFQPVLGADAYGRLTGILSIDDNPAADGHRGSAFQSGWYGYVSKDLRRILGTPGADPFPVAFCGGGDLGACRQILFDTLHRAADTPMTAVYPADGTCAAGDQVCAASLVYSPLGAIHLPTSPWANRPTYQQVVDFTGRRGESNPSVGTVVRGSRYNNGAWSAFTPPAAPPMTVAANQVALATMPNGDVHHLAIGGDGSVFWQVKYASGGYSGLLPVDAAGIGSANPVFGARKVAAAAAANGDLQIMAIGLDGNLYHRIRHADGGWTVWGGLGWQATDVSIAVMPNGDAQVVAVGLDANAYHRVRYGGGNWSPFGMTAGGGNTSRVAVAADPFSGDANVVLVNTAGYLFNRVRKAGDGSWSAWSNIGNTPSGGWATAREIAVAIPPDRHPQVVVVATDGYVYHQMQPVGAYGWTPLLRVPGLGAAKTVAMTAYGPDDSVQVAAVQPPGRT